MLPRMLVNVFKIEAEIERGRRVRDGADRNAIDTTQRNATDRVESNATGGFEQDMRSARVAPTHRLREHRWIHVVEENHVEYAGLERQKSIELIERIDFTLDECDRSLRACARRGRTNTLR